MKISFIVPSRNNLKYLKWSYDSIRRNQGNHEVYICVADDASSDGTHLWCRTKAETDPYFKWIRNDSGERLGHTILYDRIINELVETEIAMIFHADMYLAKGALDEIEKHMYSTILGGIREIDDDSPIGIMPNKKTIVSLTRIEPPLHPAGVEKVIKDFGTEPEQFLFSEFDNWLEWYLRELGTGKTTEGIFAPWAFWVSDFNEIGGHDPLYAPQSKEDSDIFNRFQLNDVKFIQTWEGFVYHMTCRGSRRNTNDNAVDIYTDSPEWLAQNQRSARNFIRKWGHFVKHDTFMKPIIPHKYDIGLVVFNCNSVLLPALEPWCSKLYVDLNEAEVESYIEVEQPNTLFDLRNRIGKIDEVQNHDVIVQVDGNSLNNADANYIQLLSEILSDSGELNKSMGIGNLQLFMNKLEPTEKDLIILKTKILS